MWKKRERERDEKKHTRIKNKKKNIQTMSSFNSSNNSNRFAEYMEILQVNRHNSKNDSDYLYMELLCKSIDESSADQLKEEYMSGKNKQVVLKKFFLHIPYCFKVFIPLSAFMAVKVACDMGVSTLIDSSNIQIARRLLNYPLYCYETISCDMTNQQPIKTRVYLVTTEGDLKFWQDYFNKMYSLLVNCFLGRQAYDDFCLQYNNIVKIAELKRCRGFFKTIEMATATKPLKNKVDQVTTPTTPTSLEIFSIDFKLKCVKKKYNTSSGEIPTGSSRDRTDGVLLLFYEAYIKINNKRLLDLSQDLATVQNTSTTMKGRVLHDQILLMWESMNIPPSEMPKNHIRQYIVNFYDIEVGFIDESLELEKKNLPLPNAHTGYVQCICYSNYLLKQKYTLINNEILVYVDNKKYSKKKLESHFATMFSCRPYLSENLTIRVFENEADMIWHFFKFACNFCDIQHGHNITGFDWPFLIFRFNIQTIPFNLRLDDGSIRPVNYGILNQEKFKNSVQLLSWVYWPKQQQQQREEREPLDTFKTFSTNWDVKFFLNCDKCKNDNEVERVLYASNGDKRYIVCSSCGTSVFFSPDVSKLQQQQQSILKCEYKHNKFGLSKTPFSLIIDMMGYDAWKKKTANLKLETLSLMFLKNKLVNICNSSDGPIICGNNVDSKFYIDCMTDNSFWQQTKKADTMRQTPLMSPKISGDPVSEDDTSILHQKMFMVSLNINTLNISSVYLSFPLHTKTSIFYIIQHSNDMVVVESGLLTGILFVYDDVDDATNKTSSKCCGCCIFEQKNINACPNEKCCFVKTGDEKNNVGQKFFLWSGKNLKEMDIFLKNRDKFKLNHVFFIIQKITSQDGDQVKTITTSSVDKNCSNREYYVSISKTSDLTLKQQLFWHNEMDILKTCLYCMTDVFLSASLENFVKNNFDIYNSELYTMTSFRSLTSASGDKTQLLTNTRVFNETENEAAIFKTRSLFQLNILFFNALEVEGVQAKDVPFTIRRGNPCRSAGSHGAEDTNPEDEHLQVCGEDGGGDRFQKIDKIIYKIPCENDVNSLVNLSNKSSTINEVALNLIDEEDLSVFGNVKRSIDTLTCSSDTTDATSSSSDTTSGGGVSDFTFLRNEIKKTKKK